MLNEVFPSSPNPAEPGVWPLCVRIPCVNEQTEEKRSKSARVLSHSFYSEAVARTSVFLGSARSLPLHCKVIHNNRGYLGRAHELAVNNAAVHVYVWVCRARPRRGCAGARTYICVCRQMWWLRSGGAGGPRLWLCRPMDRGCAKCPVGKPAGELF